LTELTRAVWPLSSCVLTGDSAIRIDLLTRGPSSATPINFHTRTTPSSPAEVNEVSSCGSESMHKTASVACVVGDESCTEDFPFLTSLIRVSETESFGFVCDDLLPSFWGDRGNRFCLQDEDIPTVSRSWPWAGI